MESEILSLYPLFFWLGLALFVMVIYRICFEKSKTRTYRQDLSNMYIVGKIKQIANKEGISLMEEFAEFAKVTKNKKIDFESIDMTVEREMQEKIAEKSEADTLPGIKTFN